MNFASNILNSIPVVGHVKGVIHHAVGDTRGGNEAMYQATRTTGVVTGSVVGCVAGGPLGAIGGAMAGGAAVDKLVSVASDKPHGVFGASSITELGLTLALDGIGGAITGIGGATVFVGQVGNAVTESAMTAAVQTGAKSSAEGVVKTVVKTTAEVVGKEILRDAAKEVVVVSTVEASKILFDDLGAGQRSQPGNRGGREGTESGSKRTVTIEKPKQEDTAATAASGSGGGQPPKKNKKPSFSDQAVEVFNLLKSIFDSEATEWANLRVGDQYIFRNLDGSQRRYLVSQIYALIREGLADTVLSVTRDHIEELQRRGALPASEMTYVNFLSFLSAATTGVRQKLIELERSRFQDIENPEERRDKALETLNAGESIGALVTELATLFTDQEICTQISQGQREMSPCFRDFYAALSHWLKHRGDVVGLNGEFLSIQQYFENGQEMLRILGQRYGDQLQDLLEGRRSNLGFARVMASFGLRRLIIVLKRLEQVVLSTIYIKDEDVEDDEQSDEFIQNESERNKWEKQKK